MTKINCKKILFLQFCTNSTVNSHAKQWTRINIWKSYFEDEEKRKNVEERKYTNLNNFEEKQMRKVFKMYQYTRFKYFSVTKYLIKSNDD